MLTAEVFPGSDRGWFLRLKAGNGEILLVSEAYVSKWNAKRAARRLGLEPVEKKGE